MKFQVCLGIILRKCGVLNVFRVNAAGEQCVTDSDAIAVNMIKNPGRRLAGHMCSAREWTHEACTFFIPIGDNFKRVFSLNSVFVERLQCFDTSEYTKASIKNAAAIHSVQVGTCHYNGCGRIGSLFSSKEVSGRINSDLQTGLFHVTPGKVMNFVFFRRKGQAVQTICFTSDFA